MNWFRRFFRGPSTPSASAPDRAAARAAVADGFERQGRGDSAGARSSYERALAADPGSTDAIYLLGTLDAAEGRHADAVPAFLEAIERDPSEASFHGSLGASLRALGRGEDACDAYAAAVACAPHDSDYRNDHASMLATLGRRDEAIDAFEQALERAPDDVRLLYNLGNVLREAGRLTAALERYLRAAVLAPTDASVLNNLGLVHKSLGDMEQAETLFRAAESADPAFIDASNNLGVVLQMRKRTPEAVAVFESLLSRAPGYIQARANLGLTLQQQGSSREAAAQYRAYLAEHDSTGMRMRLATLLPVVPRSVAEIGECRARYRTEVSALSGRGLTIDDPLSEVGSSGFFLAYHGRNNRELHALVASVHRELCPALDFTAPHCLVPRTHEGRLRIGFISKFMHDHSIGRTTSGLLAQLDRDRFEVIAIFIAPFVDDEMSEFICASADRVVKLPESLASSREEIAKLELDVLFFQDIGMDPFAYFLAHARLAPVQCVSFGHPDTTGIPSMDYFVTSDLFEPAGHLDHYSERPFLLRGLGTLAYYYRPVLQSPAKTRADFGLPGDRHLYVCAQALFKFHPEFDAILGGILRADPMGVVVLVRSSHRTVDQLLEERFSVTIADVAQRVVFVPGMSRADFLNLLAVADVALDTIHFNGMNTSLEALALGTPLVTMPTDLQRGRHTFGMYTRMGVEACIAHGPEEYVSLAVRLGTDRDERDRVSERILATADCLFEDERVVREFERFFEESTSNSRR